jgi:hypothetical protein
MCRGPIFTPLEVAAIRRLRDEDRLTWRAIARIMHRDHTGVRRAYFRG